MGRCLPMRVKIRFIADVAQPAMFADLRWLPRPGETVDLAYRKTIEVVEVVRIYNDKRCDAVVRGKLLQPARSAGIASALPMGGTSNLPSAAPQGLGSKTLEELLALARSRMQEAAAAAVETASRGTEFLRASLAPGT